MQKNLNQLLFGDKAILVTEKIADHRQSLYPEERALISGVIEKRAHEFSTGRFCARQALLEFGIDNFPVLRGEQREPIWPKNIVGSISPVLSIRNSSRMPVLFRMPLSLF